MIHLFYPMGGAGRRFKEAGFTDPKPLIQVAGKRLIQLAVEPTKDWAARRHYLITMEFITAPMSAGLLPPGCWHVLMEPTLGPLQTMLQARACLDTEEEVLICDCDSFMNGRELADALEVFRSSGATGGVTVRKTTDPMCSFAELDEAWWVTQTREKDPFTSWSTTGPYWFRTGKLFLEAAKKAAAAQHTSISPVYNYLGGRTKAVPVASFIHMGTPEALKEFKRDALTTVWR